MWLKFHTNFSSELEDKTWLRNTIRLLEFLFQTQICLTKLQFNVLSCLGFLPSTIKLKSVFNCLSYI